MKLKDFLQIGAVVLFIFWTTAFNSCSQKSTVKTNLPVTVYTTITAAVDWNRNIYAFTTAIRTIKDSIMPDSSNKAVNIVFVDTLYYIPNFKPKLDSLGKPLLDSLKKPIEELFWTPLDKKLVLQDFNKNWGK